eukprot:m.144895 g.144895  ORF g.144895 m.144895 type:complete len:401 (-) comp15019_c1_seq7:99-1301(-)
MLQFLGGVVLGTALTLASYLFLQRNLPLRSASKSSKSDSKQPVDESTAVLNLLYNIAADQARKEGYVHRGITCNHCRMSPLRGIRYKCANCIDFDLCENCEPQDHHCPGHVFVQLRIPLPPLCNPRKCLLAPLYPGRAAATGHLAWEELQRLEARTHFEQVEIEALFDQYRLLCSTPRGIDKLTFHACLGPIGAHPNLVTERIFRFFDHDADGIIGFGELVAGLSVLCKGTQEEKLLYAFKGYDLGDTGFVTRLELRNMLQAYFLINMELVKDVVRVMEEQMIAGFNDLSSNPVSAAFTAPAAARPAPPPGATKRQPSGLFDTFSGTHRQEGMGVLLEAMSGDAIDELVERAFRDGDTDRDGRLSLAEFKAWAAADATIVAWFEALGVSFEVCVGGCWCE